MKIVSWNVNGLRAINKKGFLDFVKKSKADILCLQEIKLQKEQLPEELKNLDDYHLIVSQAKKKGYSGTLVYSRLRPKATKLKIGFKRFDNEGRVILLQYPGFLLINLYLPHGGRDKSKLDYKLKAYNKLFDFLKKIRKRVILIGDFNIAHQEIDLARPKQNQNNIMFTPKEREQITKLLNLGFMDTYRILYPQGKKYSWWPYFAKARKRGLGWRIDYAFVSDSLKKKVKDANIKDRVLGSDHCPISIEINI